ISGLNMRFKVSAPTTELVSTAGAKNGTLGVNILFHGDGGTSFFDFPNQGVKGGLMGVALLSPDPGLRWGGSGRNLQRQVLPAVDYDSRHVSTKSLRIGPKVLHIELPKIVNFDKSKIFMEGISGGAIMLSGHTIPAFGASLGVKGVIMGCGGTAPQVQVQGDISSIRIHWQTTVNELASLKQTIPQGVAAYSQIATNAGFSAAQVNQLQTADGSPNGGHCAFDTRGFVSGVQLLTDNFASILAGQGTLNGVSVNKGVVGAGNLFGNAGAANANANANAGATTRTGANTANRVNTANRNTNTRVNTANRNRVQNTGAASRNRVNAATANRNRVAARPAANTANRNRVNTANRGRVATAASARRPANAARVARPAAARVAQTGAARGNGATRVNRVNNGARTGATRRVAAARPQQRTA
ncbi:hypothetical protein PLEOSDRAFT_1049660, partial [Pleurotus ostreatus PC15]